MVATTGAATSRFGYPLESNPVPLNPATPSSLPASIDERFPFPPPSDRVLDLDLDLDRVLNDGFFPTIPPVAVVVVGNDAPPTPNLVGYVSLTTSVRPGFTLPVPPSSSSTSV